MLAKLRLLALILALIAATIPSSIYITDKNRDILWILIGVNIFVYIMVALTTIQTTLDVAGRDKQKLPVPARFENNPILAKWWVAVRLSWRWHAVAALARLGLAHGLAQHIHSIRQTWNDFQGIISPFFATTYYGEYPVWIRSHWSQVIIAIVILIFFSAAETGFITSLTLTLKTHIHRATQILKVVLLRGGLIVGIILTMVVVQGIYKYLDKELPMRVYSYNDESALQQLQFMRQYLLNPLKIGHGIVFNLLDNGTMMAAEIMIMEDENLYRSPTTCSEYNDEPQPRIFCTQRDRILRSILFSFLGLLLYAFLTGGCLFFAHRRYRRQEKIAPNAV